MTYWTAEMLTHIYDAPWPATKEELLDYAKRSGAPVHVIQNLHDLEDGIQYELDDLDQGFDSEDYENEEDYDY